VLVVVNSRLPLGAASQKYVTLNMIGLLQRPFCWSLTPNSLTRKIAVKPCMNRKSKIWWCFILHETVGNTRISRHSVQEIQPGLVTCIYFVVVCI
jgi:hypothetical protein